MHSHRGAVTNGAIYGATNEILERAIEILASGLTPFSDLPESDAQPAIGTQQLESNG